MLASHPSFAWDVENTVTSGWTSSLRVLMERDAWDIRWLLSTVVSSLQRFKDFSLDHDGFD